MVRISVITTTLNAEKHIGDFLRNLRWADEVVITDAGSVDRTVDIARRFKNVVIYFLKGCSYSEGFQNSFEHASGDWVLMLGVDEYVTRELAREIRLTVEDTDFDGFRIPSLIFVLDKWIVDFPCRSRNVRLARRDKARFLEKRIHESMVVDGKIGFLNNPYYHFQDNSVSERLKKLDKYTTLGAIERWNNGQRFSIFNLFYRPLKYFIWQFIFLKKFTQGVRGLYLAMLKGFYQFIEEMKLYEMETRDKNVFKKAVRDLEKWNREIKKYLKKLKDDKK